MEDESVNHDSLDDLSYLENVIDFRGDRDRGALAEKEVLVYSPPRTGSTSLYIAARRHLEMHKRRTASERRVLHDHNNGSLINILKLPRGIGVETLEERCVIGDLLRYKKLKSDHVQIISSFRDPLPRAISHVFQIAHDAWRFGTSSTAELSFEWLYERLLKIIKRSYDQPHPVQEIEDDFFKRETFDDSAKDCFVDRGHYQILVVCLEHVSCWRSALEKHLGYEGIEIGVENKSTNKPLNDVYRDFEENLSLPQSTIDTIYFGDNLQQSYLRWFYTEQEIRTFYECAMDLFGVKPTPGSVERPAARINSDKERDGTPAGLRYLKEAVDYEGGRDRGSLSEKQLLVYAPMKTGTVTLYHALCGYMTKHRQWYMAERGLLHNHHNRALLNNLKVPDHIDASKLVKRSIVADLIRYKQLTGGHVQIVSSFRDPLDRSISYLFQHIDDLVTRECRLSLDDITFGMCREKLQKHLMRVLGENHPLEEIEDDFFEQEMFDHESKSCYVNRGHYELLVLCLEHVEHWRAALENHLGYKGIEIDRHHATRTKSLAKFYSEFKDNLELDEELLQRIYFGEHAQQKQLRWFYSDREIEGLFQQSIKRYGPQGKCYNVTK